MVLWDQKDAAGGPAASFWMLRGTKKGCCRGTKKMVPGDKKKCFRETRVGDGAPRVIILMARKCYGFIALRFPVSQVRNVHCDTCSHRF